LFTLASVSQKVLCPLPKVQTLFSKLMLKLTRMFIFLADYSGLELLVGFLHKSFNLHSVGWVSDEVWKVLSHG